MLYMGIPYVLFGAKEEVIIGCCNNEQSNELTLVLKLCKPTRSFGLQFSVPYHITFHFSLDKPHRNETKIIVDVWLVTTLLSM